MKVIPSEKYKKALEEIQITDKQLLMLEAHYNVLNKSITYLELAKSAGYEDYEAANSQYGKLGRVLGEAVGFEFQNSQIKTDSILYSSAIGMPNSYTDGDFQLVMHHELATALKDSELFKS